MQTTAGELLRFALCRSLGYPAVDWKADQPESDLTEPVARDPDAVHQSVAVV